MSTATALLGTGTEHTGPERAVPHAPDVATLLHAALGEGLVQPCRTHDPDLWFSESPAELERAKQLCGACPVRVECLAAALARGEFCGVWGGQIIVRGAVVAHKRARGRPRTRHIGQPSGG